MCKKKFEPKKTITIQMSIELHNKMEILLKTMQISKTKLLEKFVTEAYDDLFQEQRI